MCTSYEILGASILADVFKSVLTFRYPTTLFNLALAVTEIPLKTRSDPVSISLFKYLSTELL